MTMSGYGVIHVSTSACVHFVGSDDVDSSIFTTVSELKRLGISYAYLNYSHGMAAIDIVNDIGKQLHLEYWPYGGGPVPPLVPFLDDLCQLSQRVNGVALVIDSADLMFKEAQNDAFNLIEAFLIQFEDWFNKKKPCHLCFQVERNDLVREAFCKQPTA